MAELVAAGIQPLQNLSVQFKYSDDAEKRKEWAQFWINRGFTGIQGLGVLIKGTNVQLPTASEDILTIILRGIYFSKHKYMYLKILGSSLTSPWTVLGVIWRPIGPKMFIFVCGKTLRYRSYNITVNLTFS